MESDGCQSLRIHALMKRSRANGPGWRAGIWLQGCPFDCSGCFNMLARTVEDGQIISLDELRRWTLSIERIEGITISGGEPTMQLPSLVAFLECLRVQTNWSILVFSGRTRTEILRLPQGRALLNRIDVLIDGPYDDGRANPAGVWPSSANQCIHLLTKRYSLEDFAGLPSVELAITPTGDVIASGMDGGMVQDLGLGAGSRRAPPFPC
jgi:anaerobic ribonucleoside-triphosphate reductase activating protein